MTANTHPMGKPARTPLAHLPAVHASIIVKNPELAQALQELALALQERFLRLHEVKQISGLSSSVLYEMMADDLFPPPYRIGMKASGWKYSEVMAWVNSRPTCKPPYPETPYQRELKRNGGVV